LNAYIRSTLLGATVAFIGLAVGGALLSFYVEWIWFSDNDAHHRVQTWVLFGAWIVVPLLTGIALSRRFRANLLVTMLVAVVLLAPAGFLGLRVVSHNNLCFAGGAYPLDESIVFGRECGR